jgi:hypothetical protein
MHKKGYQVKFDDEPMNHWQHGACVASQEHEEITYINDFNYTRDEKRKSAAVLGQNFMDGH